ncbi:ABC transporter permease [Agromyces sp. MMS24-JH15]|uniref:ABC transporter permease n=1 Tax=Agromyces sp. MMS24-JH15 TaxID=3243765 RepID=UPI00374A69C4
MATPHFVEQLDREDVLPSAARDSAPERARYPWFRVLVRIVVDAILVLWGAATLSFFVMQALPGEPVDVLITDPEAPQELRDQITREYGLDQPLWIQYVVFLGRLARGNLGQSFQLRKPVADAIGAEMWPTITLTVVAFFLAILIASIAAVLTSGRAKVARASASFIELTIISVPTFWIGLLLLAAFSYTIPIFPDSGDRGPISLVLPAITVAAAMIGTLAQILRQGMESTLGQPFILSARSRGISETSVRVRHAYRHSMLAGITLSAMFFGFLLGGAVITETIFARPGIGRLALSAINSQDIPLVIGVVIFSSIAFVIVNSIVDLLYPLIDPRLRQVHVQGGFTGRAA